MSAVQRSMGFKVDAALDDVHVTERAIGHSNHGARCESGGIQGSAAVSNADRCAVAMFHSALGF